MLYDGDIHCHGHLCCVIQVDAIFLNPHFIDPLNICTNFRSITSTFLNMNILVSEHGHTDKCTWRNRVFCCCWIKNRDISLLRGIFLLIKYQFYITHHCKITSLLSCWIVQSKNNTFKRIYIYILCCKCCKWCMCKCVVIIVYTFHYKYLYIGRV